MVRLVSIAYVEGNVLLPHGENRPLVQHLCADIAKLPQFAVCKPVYMLRIFNYARIRHKYARNISPVFVYVRVKRRRRQRARHVAAAAREREYAPAGGNAVKAGYYRPPVGCNAPERGVACFFIYAAVQRECEPQLCVNKVIAQCVRQQPCGKVFAAAYKFILTYAVLHALPQRVKFGLERGIKPKLVPNVQIPLLHLLKYVHAGYTVFDVSIAKV